MIEKAIIKQTHLVKKTVRIEADQLPALFEYTEYLPFEFGIYKDGPTFLKLRRHNIKKKNKLMMFIFQLTLRLLQLMILRMYQA